MDQRKYSVYIVASNSGTLYIGVTGKLYVRVMQHKSGEIEGFFESVQVQPAGVL
jgi:predicted GIY-YIG superfamily endonuclease